MGSNVSVCVDEHMGLHRETGGHCGVTLTEAVTRFSRENVSCAAIKRALDISADVDEHLGASKKLGLKCSVNLLKRQSPDFLQPMSVVYLSGGIVTQLFFSPFVLFVGFSLFFFPSEFL